MRRENLRNETPLPSGYTRLNYIEATGTQSIGTGYYVDNKKTRIVCDMMKTGTFDNGVFFGCASNSDNQWFCNLSSLPNSPDALTTGGNTTSTLILSNWGDNVGKVLFIEGNPRILYYNESFNNQSAVYTPNLPSNWADNANTIYVGITPDSNYINKQAYMQDLLFFNRALSDPEIQQLYSVL